MNRIIIPQSVTALHFERPPCTGEIGLHSEHSYRDSPDLIHSP